MSVAVQGYTPSEWGRLFHGLPGIDELLGAGSAGPGKSMVLLMDPLEQVVVEHQRCLDPRHPYKLKWGNSTGWALHLRREFPMLQETIERSKRYFPLLDPAADYKEKDNMWVFSSGFKYQFGHCQHDDNWQNYLSKQYTHIGFDELTQFNEDQYFHITARLRSGDPILKNMLKVRACSNPYCKREKGQNYTIHNPHWVRERFIDPAPNGKTVIKRKLTRQNGEVFYKTRMYLPATLYDNPDKEFVTSYEATLLDKPPHIRQAMLYGDWYTVVGGHYVDHWIKQLHTCDPFTIPRDWPIFRAMDWGFKHPGVIGWFAVDPEGTLYMFHEFKFKGMDARQVAQRVREIETKYGLWQGSRSRITGPADTQLWEERGDVGITKAQEFAKAGVPWVQANKKSRARNSQLFISRLQDHNRGTTHPGIVFFKTCTYCIKTVPAIQTDVNDIECPQEGGDDHGHDMVLYACSYAGPGGALRRVGTSKARARERFEDELDADRDDWEDANRGRGGYGSSIL